MARQSRTRYTVLGVLTLGPKSGYDIKKFIERSVGNFWRESYGQIYPTLKKLDAEGLVSHEVEGQEGRPDRFVYRISNKGRRELRDWLVQPVEIEIPRHELLLKLFFGTQVPTDANLDHIAQYRDEVETWIDRLKQGDRLLRDKYGDTEQCVYWLLTIRQGILVNEALAQWCKEAEVELKKRKKNSRSRRSGKERGKREK
jgi:DNA-binding PadR family transcriptional regulator